MTERAALDPRILGTELEYSARLIGERGYDSDERITNETLCEALPADLRGLNTFLTNGARFYLEGGYHPEYATPECVSLDDLVASEFAGERIVYATMQALAAGSGATSFELNRRVTDHQQNSWGAHESYSCKREFYSIITSQLIALHAVTRNIYAGAGTLLPWGGFAISQKSNVLTRDISYDTVHQKPVVVDRNEPHADESKLARLQIVGGDAPMSPWAFKMKVGTTALVLDVIEHGRKSLWHLVPMRPIWQVGRQVAGDLTLQQTVLVGDRRELRPLDIQREILETVRTLSDDWDLGAEKMSVIAEWQRALDDLEADPMRLVDRADWPLRQELLERARIKHAAKPWKPSPESVDYQWDTLHKNGIGQRLRRGLWSRWMPPEQLIAERVEQPPQTRAVLRAELIRRALASGGDPDAFEAGWEFFREYKPSLRTTVMYDPFATEHDEVHLDMSRPA